MGDALGKPVKSLSDKDQYLGLGCGSYTSLLRQPRWVRVI